MRDGRAIGVGGLAPGYGHLEPREVATLVATVCDPEHPEGLGATAISAICLLERGLGHVDSTQFAMIVELAFSPHANHDSLYQFREFRQACTMAILGPQWKRVETRQRQELFRMVSDRSHPNALRNPGNVGIVIGGWGKGAQHFGHGELDALFELAASSRQSGALANDLARADAICGMGFGLKFLQPEVGMGQGLQHLHPCERSALVASTLGLIGRAKAVAVAGIGQQLQHLESEEHQLLVAAARQMPARQPDDEEAGAPSERFLSMRGLAIGAQNWAKDLLALRDDLIVKEEI